tara:strand:- start:2835 stop:3200 length:366 start_codon:yes stop_codon:yes gene_type:complete
MIDTRNKFKVAVQSAYDHIANDLKELYGTFTFKPFEVIMPPKGLDDGAFIYFRGYFVWSEVPEDDKVMILQEWIPDILKQHGLEGYWVPQPKETWMLNQVLRIYSSSQNCKAKEARGTVIH